MPDIAHVVAMRYVHVCELVDTAYRYCLHALEQRTVTHAYLTNTSTNKAVIKLVHVCVRTVTYGYPCFYCHALCTLFVCVRACVCVCARSSVA